MPRVRKENSQGWPTWIKNKDEREAYISKSMNGLRYDGANEVRFKQPLNKVIQWNQVQKFKRAAL